MEFKASGNIYRLTVVYLIIATIPAIRRREKVSALILYYLLTSLQFLFLHSQYPSVSIDIYIQFITLYLFIFLIVSFVSYNSYTKTFLIKHNLLEANKELEELNTKLKRQAVIDELTQINNRRAFDQYMSIAWRAAITNKSSISVVMADIDNFKEFNDTYGHQAGDNCLHEVAQALKRVFHRESDFVARYGGEEFIVLTVDQDIKGARKIAEKAREAVLELQIPNENSLSGPYTTISLGVASAIPTKSLRYEKLIKRADVALYQAKEEGRNRVGVDLEE